MLLTFKNYTDKPLKASEFIKKHPQTSISPKGRNWKNLWWLLLIFGLLGFAIWANSETTEENADLDAIELPEEETVELDSATSADLERLNELNILKKKKKFSQSLQNEMDSLLRVLFPEEINGNHRSFVGHQCVYMITIDGKVFKFGKTIMTQLDKKSKLPRRLEDQLKLMRELLPDLLISGKIVFQNINISTKDIETKETEFIQKYVNSMPKHLPDKDRLPRGNKSHLKKIKF